MKLTRRKFIQAAGALSGSILLLPSCAPCSPYRVFSPGEAECLIALCEQIIPADRDPGATDAGVIHFIDKLLHERFPHLLPLYRQGIAALEASCGKLHAAPFAALPPARQTEVMKLMETDALPEAYWAGLKASAFFRQLVRNTMQGFYGPPRHGGNKNYASYRMLKLDFPLVVGQNNYRHE
jgi:gluconate 2-dehydrogenase gamma chain